ncbi:MAG: RNA polymerase sigma-54 factor [Deltaproteobacteria bacterium]|nr:MAG: RNA polymerase sigma-54 factor [Deltaproteobacteria bacterium]
MAMEFRLNQGLSQTLSQKMTPRMQQAIKLLQYNRIELTSHIEQELLENPTLEVNPSDDPMSEREQRLEDQRRKEASETKETPGETDFDWEGFIREMNDRPRTSSGGSSGFDELPPIEANLTYERSLTDHLLDQLATVRCAEDERVAAEALIRNLNTKGFLDVDIQVLAEDLGQPPEDVDFVRIDIVAGLDPIGCGARDLVESLVIQARQAYPEDPNFQTILQHHLQDLAHSRYGAIARALDLHEEDVLAYHEDIKRLEPNPGRAFSTGDDRYITPDVYVFRVSGEWMIQLNEEGIPDLKVGRQYESLLRKGKPEEKKYIKERLESARFLIQSIDKRRSTIRRVMESILKFQRDFFEGGVQHLRPLILEDVAGDIGVHMSTVSRVTSNKYAHTPHGIFELKFFFSTAVKQADGGADVAAASIKAKIKQLIDAEDRAKPLSDSAIEKKLKAEGVQVARRTVAKYREQLGYLSSKLRKQRF